MKITPLRPVTLERDIILNAGQQMIASYDDFSLMYLTFSDRPAPICVAGCMLYSSLLIPYDVLGEEQEGSRAGGQGEDAVPRLKFHR